MLLGLVAFAFVPTLIIAILARHIVWQSVQELRLSQLDAIADLKRTQIESFFDERRLDVILAADLHVVRTQLPVLARPGADASSAEVRAARAELDRELAPHAALHGYHDIQLLSAQGTVVYVANAAHTETYLGKRLPDERLLASALTRYSLADVQRDGPKQEEVILSASAPVHDAAGMVLGALVFQIDVRRAADVVQDSTGLGRTGEAVIARQEGDEALFLFPVRSNPDAALRQRMPLGTHRGSALQEAVQARTGSGSREDYRGVPVLAAWRYLPSLGWGLVVKIDADEAFAPAVALRNLLLLLGLALLAAGLTFAFATARSITRPITALQRSTEIIGAGDLDHEVTIDARDEIGRFARSFSRMTRQLREKIGEQQRTAAALGEARDELERRVLERTAELSQAIDAVRSAGEYNRSLIEASPDPLVTIGPDGKIADLNAATEEATGRTRAELVGTDFSVYFTDAARARAQYEQTFREGSVRDFPLGLRHRNGAIRHVLYNATVYRNEAKAVAGVIAAARDVTDMRRAEATRAQLAGIVETSEDAIVGEDLGGVIRSWNRGATKIYGYSAAEAIGRAASILVPPDREDEGIHIPAAIAGGQVVEPFETARLTRDGRRIDVAITASAIEDADGRVIGTSTIGRDISGRRRAEELIRVARDELEERVRERTADLERANELLSVQIADRVRAEEQLAALVRQLDSANQGLSDFAYIVSHDLKAPLRTISTLSRILAADYADVLDAEGREHLRLLGSRVQRMYHLVDGILAYSRIGGEADRPAPVDVGEVVAQVVDLLGPRPGIQVSVGAPLPTLRCDRTQLQQVFQNLIGNAIKFMDKPEGQIHVGCAEVDDYHEFLVSDNGPGIASQHFDRIFNIFQTLHSRDQLESTGIGLAVVKKIVYRHGGRAWVDSTLGKGSTFHFTMRKESPPA